jgi:hypothetical protein
MTSDQINDLHDTFRSAMLDWDVSVSAKVADENHIDISFELWAHKLEGSFELIKDKWSDGQDCPHYIGDCESVWIWIAMQLSNKIGY